jgi:glucan 1,3-beta-glucosidase
MGVGGVSRYRRRGKHQITVGVSRGMLFESTGPNWLYDTACEHSILYQYNFVNVSNTFAGMIQTESAYFQAAADTESPGTFNSSVGQYAGDPVFPESTCNGTSPQCNLGWVLMMQSTTNVSVAGACLYSWYDKRGLRRHAELSAADRLG